MFKNIFKSNDAEPEIDLAEDIKKKNRNFVIVFSVLAIIFFNLIMWMLSKV
ncbi:MAG: hypothetical protein V1773_12940 [bacterium]